MVLGALDGVEDCEGGLEREFLAAQFVRDRAVGEGVEGALEHLVDGRGAGDGGAGVDVFDAALVAGAESVELLLRVRLLGPCDEIFEGDVEFVCEVEEVCALEVAEEEEVAVDVVGEAEGGRFGLVL
ncbi:MAG: hypothetical protein ACF8R7_02205 [Phycisphaerales bacterium JB039]